MSKLAKICALFLLALAASVTRTSVAQTPLTLEEMKGEADRARDGRQAKLYAELAARMVDEAGQQFAQGNVQLGQARVQDVLTYASRARDVALTSKAGTRDLKETEMALHRAGRGLGDLKLTLALADRPPLDAVEKKLEQLRQDLLDVLFAPKKKKNKP